MKPMTFHDANPRAQILLMGLMKTMKTRTQTRKYNIPTDMSKHPKDS
jgi:hypothetical protein